MKRSIVLVILTLSLGNAAPPVEWRNAEVVSVRSWRLFRFFEVVDSFDPRCQLTYWEFRNPFRPLALKVGTTAQIASGRDNHIYLKDERGRVHKGALALQELMVAPAPSPGPTRAVAYAHCPLKELTRQPSHQ